ncbi:MAG: sigma-70 family RNA polymerase sigma factor [Gemmataceae bacterium]|nr:sigma-70 family RNA polymerase sigma factor [Gemmataceae bacterium]
MVNHRLANVMRHLGRLVGRADGAELPDGQLLERFAVQHDHAAFEALVRRHGRLVLGVCQRVLQDLHAAEDAFQAVFLVLARKASSLDRSRPLTSWLYTVAYRLALRARSAGVRQRQCQEQAQIMHPDLSTTQPADEAATRELRQLLDEELNRLPEKYRMPLVLCYLEEKSHEEAARELGLPRGSIAKRLAGAQERLRQRLVGRGLALSGGSLVAKMTETGSAAVVSPGLIDSTVTAAVSFAAGSVASGLASLSATALAEGVMKTMFVAKLKAVVAVGVALGIAVGGGLFAYSGMADPVKVGEQPPVAAPKPERPTAEKIAAAIQNLESNRFEDRQVAADYLVAADLAALPALRAALKERHPLETTRRIESIIKSISRPERMLKVEVELPTAPVMLGVGQGRIAAKLWLKNTWDEPIVVCQPLDGSIHKERDPKYGFTLLDDKGKEVPKAAWAGCGNVNPLRAEDFIRLKPGEKVDVFNREGSFGSLDAGYFKDLRPGTYTLSVRYRMAGTGKPGGAPLGNPGAGAQQMLNEALACDLVSEPVKFRVIDAPSTEQLQTMVDRQDESEVKLADAINALVGRKQLPSFASVCKVLRHKDPRAREAAASALRLYTDAGKAEALILASRDENELVRGAAVSGMQGVKEKAVVTALIDRLGDSDFQVRYATITRLKELTGQSFGYSHLTPLQQSEPAIQKWKTWWMDNKEAFKFR